MFNAAQHYLALPARHIGAEGPAPCSAPCSPPERAAADEEAALERRPLAPMAQRDRPWGCGAGCPPRLHWPRQPCSRGCTVPELQQRVRSWALSWRSPAQGSLLVTPALRDSPDHLPPSWGTFGSYLNCAPVNPIEKKGRIPFRPPSFVCALPLLLKSLSGVQSGETPYYTFSALRKASISLTRS